MSRETSHQLFTRAKQVIPGGVNSPARAFGGVGGEPVLMRKGDGAYLWDVDGNRYIDYIGSWGPHILGHRHPAILEAVQRALEMGTSFGAPTELETELAELVVDAVPSIEMVRMVNSGTEASMSAVRVARGFTGRSKIVKFAGCYHGHVDALLVKAGSAATTLGVPSSPGVPPGATADTIVLEFNDLAEVEATFHRQGNEIAAVLLEPVVGNMGLVLPEPGFLEGLRALCTKYGALLVFDEVMTGFRVAYGGVQARLGITPDMTVLGKIIGGGMPVGAYGGRADVMRVVSPLGPVYQAGTLSGNPLAMSCGIATLRTLKQENPYARLEEAAAGLERGLAMAASEAGLPYTTARMGSMLTLFFNGERVTNYTQAARSDTKRFARFFWGLMNRGVYFPCSQFEALFVSSAHSAKDIEATIVAAREACREAAES
jgi:glutamate-1-semialdehyde 2,1-aminomutase